MSLPIQKPATTPIPVQLSATEFDAFILPHLSMPKRGPKCKLGYHRVFNLILWVLYTGMHVFAYSEDTCSGSQQYVARTAPFRPTFVDNDYVMELHGLTWHPPTQGGGFGAFVTSVSDAVIRCHLCGY